MQDGSGSAALSLGPWPRGAFDVGLALCAQSRKRGGSPDGGTSSPSRFVLSDMAHRDPRPPRHSPTIQLAEDQGRPLSGEKRAMAKLYASELCMAHHPPGAVQLLGPGRCSRIVPRRADNAGREGREIGEGTSEVPAPGLGRHLVREMHGRLGWSSGENFPSPRHYGPPGPRGRGDPRKQTDSALRRLVSEAGV